MTTRANHYKMRNGSKAKWRIAKKRHLCDANNNGYKCFTAIEPGTRYFDSGEIIDFSKLKTRKFCEPCAEKQI